MLACFELGEPDEDTLESLRGLPAKILGNQLPAARSIASIISTRSAG